MTIGQRIALKRKELTLSQEALGEALGVSRQSIYKWESDAALPEIDKLIALSRLFGVSVGWLLGVEEDTPPENAAPENGRELTETQMKMVEEIVDRYIAAQPKPRPRRKWPLVLAGFALLIAGFSLINRLDRIDDQYNRLQMTVSNVTYSVNSQIGGISSQVEEILKSQNNLTAEYGTEIRHVTRTNVILFSAYAVPKTYVEGMTVEFSADNGTGGSSTVQGTQGLQQNFSAELSCALTDDIDLSVSFLYPDGTRQTQLLEHYDGLYSSTLPSVDIRDYNLMFLEAPGGSVTLTDLYVTASNPTPGTYLGSYGEQMAPPEIEDIQVGLFKNKTLLAWAEPCEQPDSFLGFEGEDFYRLPDRTIQLTAADELTVAALITDTYGRRTVCPGMPYVLDTEDGTLTYPDRIETDRDPANWQFD